MLAAAIRLAACTVALYVAAPVWGAHAKISALDAAIQPALAPMGAVRFCLLNPQDCSPVGRPALPLTLTPPRLNLIEAVNAEVNRRISPQATPDPSGIEVWRISPARGDCNDYAVTKRRDLIRARLPPGLLALAAVATPKGESHLVLVVRTDRGDLVLDNLAAKPKLWEQTGYRVLRRQAFGDPRLWFS